jgi:hypothetical protein
MDEFDDDEDNGGDDTQERILEELHDIHSTIKSRTDLTTFVWIVIGIFLVASWSGSWLDKWTDKLWYSFRNDTAIIDVTVAKRPLDCDFFYAPLGNKGCDYKKRITVFGGEQRRALIQQATSEEQRKAYEDEPNSVTVYWEKQEN